MLVGGTNPLGTEDKNADMQMAQLGKLLGWRKEILEKEKYRLKKNQLHERPLDKKGVHLTN